jgi:hypothetical protein
MPESMFDAAYVFDQNDLVEVVSEKCDVCFYIVIEHGDKIRDVYQTDEIWSAVRLCKNTIAKMENSSSVKLSEDAKKSFLNSITNFANDKRLRSLRSKIVSDNTTLRAEAARKRRKT